MSGPVHRNGEVVMTLHADKDAYKYSGSIRPGALLAVRADLKNKRKRIDLTTGRVPQPVHAMVAKTGEECTSIPFPGVSIGKVAKGQEHYGTPSAFASVVGGLVTCNGNYVQGPCIAGDITYVGMFEGKHGAEKVLLPKARSKNTSVRIGRNCIPEYSVLGMCVSGGGCGHQIDVVIGGITSAYTRGHSAFAATQTLA